MISGRNHILLYLSRSNLAATPLFPELTGRAIIAQSSFLKQYLRPGFDIIVPPVLGPPGGDVWAECAPQLPARRKYLLSFQGKHTPRKPEVGTMAFDSEYSLIGHNNHLLSSLSFFLLFIFILCRSCLSMIFDFELWI